MIENENLNKVVVDIETQAKEGKTVPIQGAIYRFRVDKVKVESEARFLTGRNILIQSGFVPPENFRLDLKLKGGSTKKVELTDEVDLATPGLERFQTLPLDQTEGSINAIA